jgi:L-lactate dehydrogenase complex protein LldF
MRMASFVLRRPRLYAAAGRMARFTLRLAPRWLVYNRLNPWGRQRELPQPPKESFRQWYRRERDGRPSRESTNGQK